MKIDKPGTTYFKKELRWVLKKGIWISIKTHFEYWWKIIVIKGIMRRKWYCVMPPLKIVFRPRLKWSEMKKPIADWKENYK